MKKLKTALKVHSIVMCVMLLCTSSFAELLGIDFGANGIWEYDGTDFSQINAVNVDGMISVGDIMAVDVGAWGLWTYDGSTDPSQIDTWDPEGLEAWGNKLIADYGDASADGYGLWEYDGTDKTQIRSWDAENMAAWEYETSIDRLIVDFSSNGLWSYDGSAWSQLGSWDSEGLETWGSRLISDYGDAYSTGHGLWMYEGTTWTQIGSWDAENISAWEYETSIDRLVVDFGSNGFWEYDGTDWSEHSQLGTENVEGLQVWNNMLAIDNGSEGLYLYDGSNTTLLDLDGYAVDPDGIESWGNYLIIDFGIDGLHSYDGTSLIKIHDNNADGCVAVGADYDSHGTGYDLYGNGISEWWAYDSSTGSIYNTNAGNVHINGAGSLVVDDDIMIQSQMNSKPGLFLSHNLSPNLVMGQINDTICFNGSTISAIMTLFGNGVVVENELFDAVTQGEASLHIRSGIDGYARSLLVDSDGEPDDCAMRIRTAPEPVTNSADDSDTIFLVSGKGQMGIGPDTTSPTTTGDAFMHVRTGELDSAKGVVLNADSEYNDIAFRIRTKGSADDPFDDTDTKLYVDGTGKVYIGENNLTSLQHELVVDGDIRVNGSLLALDDDLELSGNIRLSNSTSNNGNILSDGDICIGNCP